MYLDLFLIWSSIDRGTLGLFLLCVSAFLKSSRCKKKKTLIIVTEPPTKTQNQPLNHVLNHRSTEHLYLPSNTSALQEHTHPSRSSAGIELLTLQPSGSYTRSCAPSTPRISSEGYWTVDLELQLRLSPCWFYIVYLSWLDSDPCYALWSCLHY